MQNANFWIITIIVCTLVATCLTKVIMKPIKKRAETRRWNRYKQEHALGMR